MQQLIGIHGIFHFRAGYSSTEVAQYWAGEWKKAITRGPLAISIDDLHLEFCYYAHLLRPVGEQGSANDLDRLDPQSQQMIRQWLDEHARDQGIGQGRITASLRQEVAALAHRMNYSPRVVETFAAWFFPEVSRYLFGDPNVRHKVRVEAANMISSIRTPRILIAHSLGSVVAYETLHHYPHLEVDLMVTIGSPLALGCVFDKLDPRPCKERGARPQGVRRWINIADKGDLIAIPRYGVRDRFDGLESDYETSIHWLDFHTANGYLATKTLADILQPHLQQSR